MKENNTLNNDNNAAKTGLNAYSLAGIGIGGIIGAGFFLGSSLAINQAGPSVILAFFLGGIIMSQVLGAMTSISINRPVQGTFRVYTEQLLGRFSGFMLGWIVFTSGILMLSSEAIASGVFLKYWMPKVSSAIFAIIALIIATAINRMGTKYFGLIETSMAVVKITILVLFIILGFLFIIRNGITVRPNPFRNYKSFFPNNISGFLQSMLIVIFTYAGINAFDIATPEVRRPCYQVPKATVLLTIGITTLYAVSMLIMVSTISWNSINTNISPFVQGFNKMGYGWASDLINIAILVSTLSVMAGTYYSCEQILISLSMSDEAPGIFKTVTQKGFYKNAWSATGLLSLLVVLISFFLGTKLFNYLISSSSYFSFLNWIINLITYLVWLKKRSKNETCSSPLVKERSGAIVTLIIILILFFISLRVSDFRIGFYISLAMLLLMCISYKLKIRNK